MYNGLKIICIIPARYKSLRFYGKALFKIKNKPLIQWTYEKVSKVKYFDHIFVATDDKRIRDTVRDFGGKIIMTSSDCLSGTDRVMEAALKLNIDYDIIVNIQGDEPTFREEMFFDLMSAFEDKSVSIATLKKEITDPTDIDYEGKVKMVCDMNGDILYLSRKPVPRNDIELYGLKHYLHVGVYGYTKDFVLNYNNLEPSLLERLEGLELMKEVDNGIKVKAVETEFESIGINYPSDVDRFIDFLEGGGYNE